MKKKIILLIILLFPYIVFAAPIKDIVKTWDLTDKKNYNGTYDTDDYLIKYSDNKLRSINKYTGESNVVSIELDGYHLFNDNKIVVIQNDNLDSVFVITYDKSLTEIGRKKIGDFQLDHCELNNDQLFISGFYENNSNYYRVIYFTDLEGNIIEQDEIMTLFLTRNYKTASGEKIFADSHNNSYYVDNYKIVSNNTNHDNTYMIASSTRVGKYSFDGELVDGINIPEGVSGSIAKKGDYYYVATSTYQLKEFSYYYIITNIYKIDENLGIINTTTIPYTENTYYTIEGEADLPSSKFGIVNDRNQIYAYNPTKNTNSYFAKYYLIDENLEYGVPSTSTHKFSDYSLPKIINEPASSTSNDLTLYQEIINKLVEDNYLERTVNNGVISYNGNINVTKDGNNYIVSVTNIRNEAIPIDNNQIRTDHYSKLTLVYYNQNLDKIFDKQIYDWTFYGSGCNYSLVKNAIIIYDNFFVLSANNNQEQLLIIYDRNGNIINDLSDTFDYSGLSILKLFPNKKGFIVELSSQRSQCLDAMEAEASSLGAELDPDDPSNGEVLPIWADPNDSNNYAMVYYSYPYLINTNITGEGNVTATYEAAVEGTVVRFTVEPKEGYVLGEVKVTDANGNVITFTDYTFTMPSSDVTIEVTFVKATVNPNTKAFITYLVIVVGIASGIITYLLFQKKSYLS